MKPASTLARPARFMDRRHAAMRRKSGGRTLSQRNDITDYHPSWGHHGEELLYHTSRYYAHTEQFLRNVTGISGFCFGSFRAQRLTPPQQEAMARLLRRPVGHATARAVIALVRRMPTTAGRRLLRSPLPFDRKQAPSPTGTRQHRRRAPGVSPADPFLNLTERFGVPVRRRGRHLWVSFHALQPLLDAPSRALRSAVQEAIEQLHDGGYRLHRRRPCL